MPSTIARTGGRGLIGELDRDRDVGCAMRADSFGEIGAGKRFPGVIYQVEQALGAISRLGLAVDFADNDSTANA